MFKIRLRTPQLLIIICSLVALTNCAGSMELRQVPEGEITTTTSGTSTPTTSSSNTSSSNTGGSNG